MIDFVLSLSRTLSNGLAAVAVALPLGYAFGAGMVSAVNPCGFAMLPAYLGLYVGQEQGRSPGLRLVRALRIGAAVTAGFVLLFGAVGLLLAAAGRALIGLIPWLGVAVGVILVLLGLWLLSGRHYLYLAAAQRLAGRLAGGRDQSARGYFLFGLAYGTASLSCTLPIFLTVVGTTLTLDSLGGSTVQFLLYGLGMGAVIMALTLSLAFFQQALARRLRRLVPVAAQAGTVLLLLSGLYILFYWATEGRALLS